MSLPKKISESEIINLKACLKYNRDDGNFYWSKEGSKRNGKIAGIINDRGYRVICLNNIKYYAHRLAWIFCYGYESLPLILDHKDSNKSNNVISNLRPCDKYQNAQNSVNKSGRYGVKGVHHIKKGNLFEVRMWHRGVMCRFGCFKDLDEAKLVAIQKRKELHGDFANYKQK